jgi:hypothetical protein
MALYAVRPHNEVLTAGACPCMGGLHPARGSDIRHFIDREGALMSSHDLQPPDAITI